MTTCFKPITLWPNPAGGRPLPYKPKGHSGASFKVPCRGCLGCRIAHEEEWSIRIMHECQMHEDNQYITLTYDEEHIPWDHGLHHSHWQTFMRRLRKATPEKLRFYMCGEYGDLHSRPHFHCIVNNLKLPDLIHTGVSEGNKIYTSAIIADAWQRQGNVYIGETVTRAVALYVAGYMLKDSDKQWKNNWEWPNKITGEMHARKKPYCQMSTHPGIGKPWLDKYFADVFPHDSVNVGGKEHPTPKYYRRILERVDPELHDALKEKRVAVTLSKQFRKEQRPKRLAVRAKCAERIHGNKTARGLRNDAKLGSGTNPHLGPKVQESAADKRRNKNLFNQLAESMNHGDDNQASQRRDTRNTKQEILRSEHVAASTAKT